MYLTAINFDDHFSDLSEDSVQFKLTCLNIAQGIEKKETTLINFIEAAGPYLINTDVKKRLKGVTILATIIDYLPRDIIVLDSIQMEYLCSFLLDRLKDHHEVVPAVFKSISSLISLKNFPADVIAAVLNGIFQNVSCQTQQAKDRFVLYKIFDSLIEKHLEEVAKMGPDFVYGVISCIENERNPENLLYLFNWYPKFCKNIKLGHLTDEMFEVLRCYFPVDYEPLNNNPSTISRDDLAEALSPGLYSIPEFGEACVSLALEKLNSQLLVAKLDSLKLLMLGTSTFTVEIYLLNYFSILTALKCELYASNSSELNKLCSETVRAISKKLSICEEYKDVLTAIYSTVEDDLKHDRYWKAVNVFLAALAEGSQKSAEFITEKIVKHSIDKFKCSDSDYKVLLLKRLHTYTKILINYKDGVNKELLKQIQNFLYDNSISTESEIVNIEGFFGLALIAPYLTMDVKDKVIDILQNELIKQNSEDTRYKMALLQCFECFAKAYPVEINVLIQENSKKINSFDELTVYLDMIGSLVKLEEYTKIILDIIVDFCTKDLESAMAALKELRKILETHQIDTESENRILKHLIQGRFVYKYILWTLSILNEIHVPIHQRFLTNLSYVIQTIIGKDTINNQQVLVDELLPRILCKQEDISIVLISSLLVRLKTEFDLNHDHLSLFISKCFNETKDHYLLSVAQELVANLINKSKNDTKLDDDLKYIEQFSEMFSSNTEVIANYNYNFVPLITKALIMRGHPQSSIWIKQIIDLLNSSDKIINGFSVILSDNMDSLNNLSYCTIRLFYKQRFFSEVSSYLCANPNNQNYINAFCLMLKNISNKVFVSEFQKNMPIIMASMENCKNADSLISLLKMLQTTINENIDIMIVNINKISTLLIKLLRFKDFMEIRILAIECLEEFLTGYPIDIIKEKKNVILTELAFCIDDKKRLVRKVATISINKWFLYGEDY